MYIQSTMNPFFTMIPLWFIVHSVQSFIFTYIYMRFANAWLIWLEVNLHFFCSLYGNIIHYKIFFSLSFPKDASGQSTWLIFSYLIKAGNMSNVVLVINIYWFLALQAWCGTIVVKWELSQRAKLSIYQSIYVPTLICGHVHWDWLKKN